MRKVQIIKWTFALVCLLPIVVNAQQTSTRLKNEFQFTAGLDSYLAFECEPSYSYMFHKNIGIVGGVRFITEIVDNLHYPLIGGPAYQWRIIGDKNRLKALLLRPAIRLQYPIVKDLLNIAVEPGILISPFPNERLTFGYTNTENFEPIPSKYETASNKGGQILAYEMKTTLSWAILDEWSILLGYNLSTFDIYSGRRNIVIEGDALNNHLPSKNKFTHVGFIGVGYLF